MSAEPVQFRGWFACLLGITVFVAACSHSSAARIRRLDEQEQQLRASVTALEAKQRQLRVEIVRAQSEADKARCHAGQESYRAVVASIFAEHATRVAEYKGCKAKKAKVGGGLAALGCGLAAFATGGVALALCGGGLALGYAASSTGCSDEPPEMTPEDIRLLAAERTGMQREPACDQVARIGARPYVRPDEPKPFLASPYGGTLTARPNELGELGPSLQKPQSRRELKREARKHRKLLRKQRREEKRRARRAGAS